MARKFLYIIAGLIVLVIGAMFVLRIYADDLTELAFVPDAAYAPPPPGTAPDYAQARAWIARPALRLDPARWTPEGAPVAPDLPVAVFFVHPTSYISREGWNDPLNDPEARARAELFVRGMASPFATATAVWAPRYRQATVGAFLVDDPRATRAVDLAYRDVLAAFDRFIAETPSGAIVIAGHSQGAYLLRRLLKDRVADTPLADRVAAAYVIGWPVSVDRDLPAMGLPACAKAADSGCVVSWLSFADPAETDMLRKAYAAKPGLDGRPVGDSAFVCTDPISGQRDGASPAGANLGTLVPDFAAQPMTASLVAGAVPSRCGPDGVLHIGAPPDLDFGPYVLPGNNYHLYDIPLFWANLRADFARRVTAWEARRRR